MAESDTILDVLVVRDDRSIVKTLENELPFYYRILAVQNQAEAKARLESRAFHIIICYEDLHGISGTSLLADVRESYPHLVRILVSDKADAEAVIEAIDKASIFKYLIEPEINEFEIALNDARAYYQSKTDGMYMDSLTQLKSREVILDMLEMELHRSQRYDGDFSAILMQVVASDSVEGGTISPTAPHLLKEIADILQSQLRTSDVAGRLSENGFLILLSNANHGGVTIFADRLTVNIQQLQSNYSQASAPFEIKVSVYSLNGEKAISPDGVIEKLQNQN